MNPRLRVFAAIGGKLANQLIERDISRPLKGAFVSCGRITAQPEGTRFWGYGRIADEPTESTTGGFNGAICALGVMCMYQDESCDHCYEYRQNGALERIHVFNLPEVATMGTAILMTLEIDDFDVSYSQGGWRGEVWIRRSGVRRQRGGCIELNPVHGIEAVAGASKENQGFDSLEAFACCADPRPARRFL
jgi:hypothetical protein